MANFHGQPLRRRGDHAKRREIHRVTIARNNLCRHGFRSKTHGFRDMFLDGRVNIGKRADSTGDRAGRNLGPCGYKAFAVTRELGVIAGKFHPERHRLGMDRVTTPDRRRHFMFFGACFNRRQQTVHGLEQDIRRLGELNRKTGIENIR